MTDHNSKKPSIMLIGLGGLGGVLLELLARAEWAGTIVACGRDLARTSARANLARVGALAQGCAPSIRPLALDLRDIEATAAQIRARAPDLILSTATRQTWWLADLLPPAPRAALAETRFGLWLPIHLALTQRLMQAVRAADYAGPVLTAPFPDVVNHVLGQIGLAPTCGIGNLDEIVPKLRLLAAERLGAPFEAVRAWLVAHHAFEGAAFGEAHGEAPPYFVRVEHAGRDVTAAIDADALLLAPYPITGGPATHFLTAGSALRLMQAILSDAGALLHAPAPGGLPGGYPVIAGAGQVQVAPVDGITLAEMVAINERSQRFDGIERIEPDGTAVFVPAAAAAAHAALGYDCARLHPAEADARADELIARFGDLAARHGVRLPI